jgi:mannose-1-phosphate guanylyltransferase / mannose-6-phosphate isomerase
MVTQVTLLPVILSGGAGTRLWPVSRQAYPKPFMTLPDGESLLQKTLERAAALPQVSEVLTVTNRDYYFQAKDEYQKYTGPVKTSFLLEPMGRNTAPAVAAAALYASQKYGDDVNILILSADHLIEDTKAFQIAVKEAQELASAGHLVTFGLKPTSPETGYGYINATEHIPSHQGSGKIVKSFVEKPNLQKAKEYVESGQHYWNSGMFCFRVGSLIPAMEKHCPEVLQGVASCMEKSNTQQPLELDRSSFSQTPSISIDYALMEKADHVAVVPCELGWSDIGSWTALAELSPADTMGNSSIGDNLFLDSENTFIQSPNHLIAALGVKDMVIVNTKDATLVAHKDKVQDVKKFVEELKQKEHPSYEFHTTVLRPWGSYTILEEGPGFKVKRIEVKPGASLSLQMHHHRSEHWIVVDGQGIVTNGDNEIELKANESTYIPAGHKHRLKNIGDKQLVMIEVQSGHYLGEDDIVRFADNYGRC